MHVSDPPLHSRGNFLDSVVELDRRLLDYIVGLDTEINELVDGSVRCGGLGTKLERNYVSVVLSIQKSDNTLLYQVSVQVRLTLPLGSLHP